MGKCVYCGKSAGLFQNKHSQCERRHLKQEETIEDGRMQIMDAVSNAIQTSSNYDELEKIISEIEQSHFVPLSQRKELLVTGLENSIEKILEDKILDETEEKRLIDFGTHFSLSQDDLNRSVAWKKLVRAAVLRDVLNGIIPQRLEGQENLPFNFQRGERVAWHFPNVEYLEDKIRREFVGRSHGIGIRLMKGVYYRVGAFKGHAVEHTERLHVDTGLLVITNQNIYFKGPLTSFRIPHSKIVSYEPFTDGIGVMRDTANAKWQIFVTGDGWFTYNLLRNIPKATSFGPKITSEQKPFNPLKRMF